MKTVAIACDPWKAPIFEDELRKAGYDFTTGPGLVPDTVTISVQAESIEELTPVVRHINEKAAASRRNRSKMN